MPNFKSLDFADSSRRLTNSIRRLLGKLPPDVADYEKRKNYVRDYIKTEIESNIPDLALLSAKSIQTGYLKGIKYGNVLNLQAGIGQKLYGVYEVELTDVLAQLEEKKYDWIINIGAAEGLYSILFSKVWPGKPVFSFEQDFCTRQLLRQMLVLNNTRHVIPLGEFKLEYIEQLNDGSKGLIFSDCEGFEAQLFSSAMSNFVANHDLVIETHDHLLPDTHDELRNELSKTHQVREIEQLTINQRVERISDSKFQNLDDSMKFQLLNEDRHPLNRWILALAD